MNSSEKLKEVREKLNLSQAEMAAKLGIKQSYYSEMERGVKGISKNARSKLFTTCKVNPMWFNSDKGNMFAGSYGVMMESEPDLRLLVMEEVLSKNPLFGEIIRSTNTLHYFSEIYEDFYRKMVEVDIDYTSDNPRLYEDSVTTICKKMDNLLPYREPLTKLRAAILEFQQEMESANPPYSFNEFKWYFRNK